MKTPKFAVKENPTALNLRFVAECESLEEIARRMSEKWPWYFVYRGGDYVGMSEFVDVDANPWSGNPNRIVLVALVE